MSNFDIDTLDFGDTDYANQEPPIKSVQAGDGNRNFKIFIAGFASKSSAKHLLMVPVEGI